MKRIYWILLLSLSASFSACKKNTPVITDPVVKIEAKTLLDVTYGSHPQQKADVYLPANRTSSTPLVIFIHGGSFIGGDKQDYAYLVKELVRENYAVLNINYRLVDATGLYDTPVKHQESSVKIKDQVADVRLAVDYALSKAKEWQISDSRIAMAGHSAGASLALLYSYDALNTNKVKVVINLAASLDLTFVDIPFYQFLLPAAVLEAGYRYTGYEAGPATDIHYQAISPLYVANASQKVPTLNVFPELNNVNGLPKQNRATFDAFTAKLNSLGIPNKFVQVAGADHEFSQPGTFDVAFRETLSYLQANLK